MAPLQRNVLADDGWAGYPASWQRLVRFISTNDIQRLLFMSGDYHFSAVAELTLWAQAGANRHEVRAHTIVASGWNASLPFANAQARDFPPAGSQTSLSGVNVGIDVRALAYSEAARQFSAIRCQPKSGGWQVDVHAYVENQEAPRLLASFELA